MRIIIYVKLIHSRMTGSMLSLSPRYDLFRFAFPKDFLPGPVEEKYKKILSRTHSIFPSPIEYLNESVQGVSIPGISDILIEQTQPGESNTITPSSRTINLEPSHNMSWTSPANPLEKINKELKVTFRQNQGLYNYFMLYETIFYRICKPLLYPADKVLSLDILDEDGLVVSMVKFYDVYIDGIDGLDFNFSKLERDSGTFDLSMKFNNIDFEFAEESRPALL